MSVKANDEKKRARARFNIFDAVLILLVILCVVGVWQRKNLQSLFQSGDSLEEYTVTFEARKMRSTTAALLTPETTLYLEEGGRRVTLGTVTDQVLPLASVEYLKDKNGQIVEAVYPQDDYEYLQDVSGTLRCRGLTHNGTFMLEGEVYLAVDRVIAVSTELADFEIRITGIQKVG
jgi:hypothetical protein